MARSRTEHQQNVSASASGARVGMSPACVNCPGLQVEGFIAPGSLEWEACSALGHRHLTLPRTSHCRSYSVLCFVRLIIHWTPTVCQARCKLRGVKQSTVLRNLNVSNAHAPHACGRLCFMAAPGRQSTVRATTPWYFRLFALARGFL